ncbi:ABC transporter permease subunit [Pseudomonas sp. RIT-PI-AD]|uniref:ABC transporter permease n=1 Tax=Pseudomonas sp. RIT-PI-AD TaxID=3035294 RepID=UPI0021DA1261|nr:ABC transporter permease subunit [Pseudomonas sp. RIT-PI-AD]
MASPLPSTSRRPPPGDGQRLLPATLLLPATVAALLFICGPLLVLAWQSLLVHLPGQVGAAADSALTYRNYLLFASPSYLYFLWGTLRISAYAALLAVLLGGLIAYRITRIRAGWARKSLIGLMLGLTFLSVLVRVYAISLTFGVGGPAGAFLRSLGIALGSREYIECVVILGFLHFLLPIVTLILLGTFQGISASYHEAARSMGVPNWRAHLDTTVRLAVPGLYSAFIVAFSLAASSFVIPLVLGQGKVMFLANLAYVRFGEMADYPGGAAVSLVLLAISLAIVGLLGRLLGKRLGRPA